jgi:hypothetical protein
MDCKDRLALDCITFSTPEACKEWEAECESSLRTKRAADHDDFDDMPGLLSDSDTQVRFFYSCLCTSAN